MHAYLPRGVSAAHHQCSLHQVFSASSQERIMDLHLELQIVAKNDQTIDQYIMKLMTIANNLVVVGESASERDIMLYALGHLDSSYNSFVYSMYMLLRKELVNSKDFQSQLMSYDKRLCSQRGSNDSLNHMQVNVTWFNHKYSSINSKNFNSLRSTSLTSPS